MGNQKSANRLLSPIEDVDLPVRDRMLDEKQRTWGDFDLYNYVTKQAILGFNPSFEVLDFEFDTTAPDLYTLSAPELAIINSYSRYPNFTAIVTASGQQFFDIYPIYTGSVGAFTSVKVQLHGDGAGHNVENTVVQFS